MGPGKGTALATAVAGGDADSADRILLEFQMDIEAGRAPKSADLKAVKGLRSDMAAMRTGGATYTEDLPQSGAVYVVDPVTRKLVPKQR